MPQTEGRPPSARLRAALDLSVELSEWFQRELHVSVAIERGNRDLLALAYAGLALEHREAILLLVEVGAHATAMAATRAVLEAYALSVWATEQATDAQLTAFAAQRFDPPPVDKILRRVTKALHPHGGSFEALRRHYGMLNDYAHGGIRQISRWVRPGEIAPIYSDSQLEEVLRFVDTIGLMAAIARATVSAVPADRFLQRLTQLLQAPADVRTGAPPASQTSQQGPGAADAAAD